MTRSFLISQCSIELEGWKLAIGSGAMKAGYLQEAVYASLFIFPSMLSYANLKVLSTMPVSTATAERFSAFDA